jgi:hypothetical protein
MEEKCVFDMNFMDVVDLIPNFESQIYNFSYQTQLRNEMKFFKHSKFFNKIARIINLHIQIPTIK